MSESLLATHVLSRWELLTWLGLVVAGVEGALCFSLSPEASCAGPDPTWSWVRAQRKSADQTQMQCFGYRMQVGSITLAEMKHLDGLFTGHDSSDRQDNRFSRTSEECLQLHYASIYLCVLI